MHLNVQLVAICVMGMMGMSVGGISNNSSQKLGPCQVCRSLVTSFNSGLERTAKESYGGGDTAWEEDNKKVYKNSELRLVEIQEKLCNDVKAGTDQCHSMASDQEHLLEEWFKVYRNQGKDLLDFLCVTELEVCCPNGHYGPNCLPCPGHPGRICSGKGKCKGSGSRKGNGECSCFSGYAGAHCDSCAADYYKSSSKDQEISCNACHKACDGGCEGPGASNCASCKEGWEVDEERGCIDINECLMEWDAKGAPCRHSEFCINTEGSYSCLKCDKACNGCYADGPDMCERCADGYVFREKLCIEDGIGRQDSQMSSTRYLTYFGMCIATCIIFQKNVPIAAGIGSIVGIYIAASEYILRKP